MFPAPLLVVESVCRFGTTCMEQTSIPLECISGVVLLTPFYGPGQGRMEIRGIRQW